MLEDASNALNAAALVRGKEAAGFQASRLHRFRYLPGCRDAARSPPAFLKDERPGSPDPVGPGPDGDPAGPDANLLSRGRKRPSAVTLEVAGKLLAGLPAAHPVAKAALLEGEVKAELTEPSDDVTACWDNRYGPTGGEPPADEPPADEPRTGPAFRTFPGCAGREERLRWSTRDTDHTDDTENTLAARSSYLGAVTCRLGHRFVRRRSGLPGAARAQVHLRLTNAGYANPFNPRELEVVFRGADGSLVRPAQPARPAPAQRRRRPGARGGSP